MKKMQKGYLLKERGLVVTDKSMVQNARDDEFEEISIVVSINEIKEWADEIELLGLDEESDF